MGINSSGAPAWFANVQVRPGAPPKFAGGEGTSPTQPPEGSVLRWRVSEPFPEAVVDGVAELARTVTSAQRWTTLDAEENGIANLARVRERNADANTVFAAVTLRSDGARTVPARVGFSDRVRLFLNGRQIFAGADEYRSRDYRFLGSMGLFDTVFLPLDEGDNELWMAVSEDFGGWGVALQVPSGRSVAVVGS